MSPIRVRGNVIQNEMRVYLLQFSTTVGPIVVVDGMLGVPGITVSHIRWEHRQISF